MAQQDALQDRNRFSSLIVQQGSTGTANTGTETMRVGGDSTSGAMYVYDLAPAGSLSVGSITVSSIDSVGTINSGTLNSVGTIPGVGTITNIGSISVIGTMPSISVGNPTGGTTDLVIRVGNIGTIESGTFTVSNPTGTTVQFNNGTVDLLRAGTITTLPNIPGGTLGLVTTVTNLSNGTIQSSGTTTGVGTITNMGSVTNVGQVYNAGTIQNILGGTVKDDGRTGRNVLTYGTTFGAGASGYGTLIGSASVGVGTFTWVQDVSVNNPYGSVRIMVGFGTALQGTSCLVNGIYGTNTGVGIEKSYSKAVNAGMTNQDLVVYLGGAGTVDVNVSYFISA